MFTQRLTVKLCALLTTVVMTLPVFAGKHDNLQLNGIASYWMMTSETYIAALYVENSTASADKLLQGKQLKRMDMRITTASWRPRSWSEEWNDAIGRNNEQSVSDDYADEILAWSNIIKGPLQAGDRIVVDYTPGESTTASINGVQVATFERPDFFHVLLSTWVGPKPPYDEFRQQILQKDPAVTGDLSSRFDNSRPEDMAARRKVVQQWQSGAGGQASDASSTIARKMYRLDVTRSILRHVVYPSRSLRARQEGTTIARITLNNAGDLLGQSIHESSGHERLDDAALEAIRRSSFSAFPESISDEELDFLVPVRFVLP